MSKFVKILESNSYAVIEESELTQNPSLYVDRSERPVYILKHYEEAGLSYWQARALVYELVYSKPNDFQDFNTVDQEALTVFAIGNQNSIIAYHMTTKGISQTDAISLAVLEMSMNISKLSADAKKYILPSPRLFQIGVKYLTWVNQDGTVDSTQANNLTAAIQGFLTEYERYAILGLEYNDEREGLMDYFESTNNYAGGGLLNYTFSPAVIDAYGSEENARNAMIAELQDLFVKGNI